MNAPRRTRNARAPHTPVPAAGAAPCDGGDGSAERASKRPRVESFSLVPHPLSLEPLPRERSESPPPGFARPPSPPPQFRARVFTAQPALPVTAEEVAEIEREAVTGKKNSRRPLGKGEPPLYSWVHDEGNPVRAEWLASRAWPAMASLLALCDDVAQDGARALGLQLEHRVSVIVNVWEPGAREEGLHDDGDSNMTVLLRLRAVQGSGELHFRNDDDVWHKALGEQDTVLVFSPELEHMVTKSAKTAAAARVTLVALYKTAKT